MQRVRLHRRIEGRRFWVEHMHKAKEVRPMAVLFEVWQSPGGKRWSGEDQEEGILTAMRSRRLGTITELAEVYTPEGRLHLRRLARYDDRVKSSADQV